MNLPAWSIIALLGGAAFLFAWVVASWIVGARDPVRRRLAAMAGPPVGMPAGAAARWTGWLAPLGRWLLPGSKTERARIERLLFIAGHRGANAVPVFFGAKVMLALALPLAWFAAAPALPQMLAGQRWLLAGIAAFVGLVAPNRWLEHRVARRQKRLRDGFPEALDMLVICVEAGLGLTSAIARVADELKYSQPELAAELAIVNAEMRTGVDREVALENLNARTGLVEIRGLVSLLVQTLRFGTGIADSLRVYSSEFRDQRMQAAEERAGKIGTKLIFPLIFCEFPAFFLIAIGPAALRIMETFGR
jgi:tight adherence protein C